MYQKIEFKKPIPSCEIYELKYNEETKEWIFIYLLNTPFELTDKPFEKELIIYDYISDLYLKYKDELHKDSVNIPINSKNQYLELLEKQRKTDIEYREKWMKENPNAVPNLIEVKNKSYTNSELIDLDIHYIASIWSEEDLFTTFAAI